MFRAAWGEQGVQLHACIIDIQINRSSFATPRHRMSHRTGASTHHSCKHERARANQHHCVTPSHLAKLLPAPTRRRVARRSIDHRTSRRGHERQPPSTAPLPHNHPLRTLLTHECSFPCNGIPNMSSLPQQNEINCSSYSSRACQSGCCGSICHFVYQSM